MDLQKKNILVVGDSMIDEYYYGEVCRVSPEAPTVVFDNSSREHSLGGAANVARHLALANQKVTLMSSVGKDAYGDIFIQELLRFGIKADYIIRESKKTTVKTRMISRNQQLFRIDTEEFLVLSDDVLSRIKSDFHLLASYSDVVIVSDYNKGFLHKDLLRCIIDYCNENKITLCVDVKGDDYKKYFGASLLKPNLRELSQLTKKRINNINDAIIAAKELLCMCNNNYIVVTCGSRGLILVSKDSYYHFEATSREIFDVTGAGDCVIAYLSACLANKYDIVTATRVSNIAAGIQVTRLGTASVLPNEISLDSEQYDCTSKILSFSEAQNIRSSYSSKRIVFTNGCFDIIHAGHIKYLERASKLGDLLIIGLNSDASVKRLKGNLRPFNVQEDRALVLAALEFVSYVVIFDEDTPINLIRTIRPDYLVKGGDYCIDDIVGSEFVSSYGGKVQVLPYVNNHSTTLLAKKLFQEKL